MTTATTTLEAPAIRDLLDRLHDAARGDRFVLLRALPRVMWDRLRGLSIMDSAIPYLRHAYIPVGREQGQLLYQTARATGAKRIFEFGTSFGVSATYLCSALRDNGGGEFFGTEIEPSKCEAARRHLDEAGFTDIAAVLEGDVFRTIDHVEGPFDLVLLDGWKDLCLDVLKLIEPMLAPGAVVFCDDVTAFKKQLRSYQDYVQNPANGYVSMTLPIGDGMEYSVWLGGVVD